MGKAEELKYSFEIELEVRDYELDCEQIVNNANYLHYMEHTRHKFCQEVGMPFIEMHKAGIDAVVRKIEIEYLSPLKSGDKFRSCIALERRGARFIFYQDLFKLSGEKVSQAEVTIVVLKEGKLSKGEEIAEIFADYL
ncbi:MAG: acyl-CoA thioesterase [Muribaculaceae bacterium]|nr:acyl-CoA thioesterase [Muribaculaceae bacterium]